MRLSGCLVLLAGLWGAASLAGEKPAASQTSSATPATKPVVILYHGHSFFEIHSPKGTRVILDPHLLPAYGRPLVPIYADVILISHPHEDHNQIDAVANKGKARIILGWKGKGSQLTWNLVQETIQDVTIRSVASYHDEEQGQKRGKNTIFIVETGGWRIVHLGDLGHLLSPEQIRQIGPVDVLLIPVGGIYTLNGSEAKQVVAQLRPREYIIPMHYGTPHFDEVLPPTEFLDGQPAERVAISKDNRLVLNRDPQRPRPLIVQLYYWPRSQRAAPEGQSPTESPAR